MSGTKNSESSHPPFECLNWKPQRTFELSTPNLSPNYINQCSGSSSDNSSGAAGATASPQSITYGIHWNHQTYPAWSEGGELRKESRPFSIQHIAQMCDQIMDVLGFQFDVSLSVFELLMSQLDSRASRSDPFSALRSLHSDYISGTQANYRKWYFASEMDQIDKIHYQDITEDTENKKAIYDDEDCSEYNKLEEQEYLWEYSYSTMSQEELLVQLLLYLFCWMEANQIRFMPECLAFLFKCSLDYYNNNFTPFPQHSRRIRNMPPFFFWRK